MEIKQRVRLSSTPSSRCSYGDDVAADGHPTFDPRRSIKNFAKLNLIPMACWIATNFQNDAPMTENIFPGLFAAAYAYIVWG